MSKKRRFALCVAAACIGVPIYEFSPALWLVFLFAGIAAMPKAEAEATR